MGDGEYPDCDRNVPAHGSFLSGEFRFYGGKGETVQDEQACFLSENVVPRNIFSKKMQKIENK